MVTALATIIATSGPAQALEHGVNFRARAGFVPDSIIDIWYFDSDELGALPYDRPSISMQFYGLEYTVAPDITGATAIFWVERMPLRIDAGYWDDRESPAEHIDGDWLEPSDGLGSVNLGINYAHEMALTDTERPVWLSLMFGGGLGVALGTGEIKTWHAGPNIDNTNPNCGPGAIAPDRAEQCGDDGVTQIPGVLPILDITASMRLHIVEYGSLRLDLGIHDVLYGGFAAGVAF